jgi:malate dehydrogenase (oxaloacetate-decarboxylating)
MPSPSPTATTADLEGRETTKESLRSTFLRVIRKGESQPNQQRIEFTMILRLSYPNRVGMLARITAAIARARGDFRSVEMVESDGTNMVRDFTLAVGSESLQRAIVQALKRISGVTIVQISNRTLQLHRGGKIEVQNKFPLDNGEVLAMAYTPGVARVCNEIVAHPESVYDYTIKGKTVAIISDGTAVLGLGDIGPEAAMPVMEGKAMLLKALAGLDAYPICLRTKDPQQIIDTVCNISTAFAAINIEDISAPRCFQIEAELQKRLDIPVFHDDQHGAAIVVFAGLVNALKLKRQKLKRVKIVINGAGAAGVAITKFLLSAGAADLIVCDRDGILSRRQSDQLSETHRWVALHTNRQGITGKLGDALKDADVFIGVSKPHIINRKMLERMAPKPIVFALANPVPEIMPEEAAGIAYIMATGRSDFPNQINNALVFPAIFRGAINVRARCINKAMKLAAAIAIAECVSSADLAPEYVVPRVFHPGGVRKVADAVEKAAIQTGVAGGIVAPGGNA